jgi:hypothetical protein
MKVRSKNYKGIEFVQLTDLPKEQKEKISESLSEDSLIKILMNEIVVSNCIQYKEYELWFDNVYRPHKSAPALKLERRAEPVGVVVALGKA